MGDGLGMLPLLLEQLLLSTPALSLSSVTPCGPSLLRSLCCPLAGRGPGPDCSLAAPPVSPSCGLHENGLPGELEKKEYSS